MDESRFELFVQLSSLNQMYIIKDSIVKEISKTFDDINFKKLEQRYDFVCLKIKKSEEKMRKIFREVVYK